MGELMRRLQQAGIERIVIDRGVQAAEIGQLVQTVARAEAGSDPAAALGRLPHIRVGRLQVEQRVEAAVGDVATFRRLYGDAVDVAERLWESAGVEGQPDADAARGMVDSLAQAVAQNRTALLALTALKNYGKVKTPTEILNKPEKLTDAEFDILRRHTVDGAEILRQTPEMPALAPVVAFEHHLRADGTGYPRDVSRPQLNLGTMLCGIADVYDAMRSQRVYQEAFPTDRILAVLQRNDGAQFDQHLVRRFSQLVGIYPAGNLVRLDSGEVAVVLKPYAADPYRPRVRVVLARDRTPLERPYEINLWEAGEGQAQSVEAPLDPAEYGIDPLAHL
jgi:hypothetical protein